jgi:hypothetical protein
MNTHIKKHIENEIKVTHVAAFSSRSKHHKGK